MTHGTVRILGSDGCGSDHDGHWFDDAVIGDPELSRFRAGFFIGESKVYEDFSSRQHFPLNLIVLGRTPKAGGVAGAAPTMPHRAFRDGYIAGWQWIRGEDEVPAAPPYSAGPGETPYREGVMKGVRDACALPPKPITKSEQIESWLGRALQEAHQD
jgi:hypothetical protein